MIYFHDTFFLKLALTNNHHLHHYHPYSSQNGDGERERESITRSVQKTMGGLVFPTPPGKIIDGYSSHSPFGLSHGPLYNPNQSTEPWEGTAADGRHRRSLTTGRLRTWIG